MHSRAMRTAIPSLHAVSSPREAQVVACLSADAASPNVPARQSKSAHQCQRGRTRLGRWTGQSRREVRVVGHVLTNHRRVHHLPAHPAGEPTQGSGPGGGAQDAGVPGVPDGGAGAGAPLRGVHVGAAPPDGGDRLRRGRAAGAPCFGSSVDGLTADVGKLLRPEVGPQLTNRAPTDARERCLPS